MKLVLVFFVVVFHQNVNSQPPNDEATLKQYRTDCMAETGFDEAIHMTESLPREGAIALYTAKEARCFYKCMAVKSGLVDEKSEPTYEHMEDIFGGIPAGMDVKATTKKCFEDNKDEEDVCEKVYLMVHCVANEIMVQSKKAKV